MKQLINILMTAGFAIWSVHASAQKPEPVYGYARQQKPMQWYRDQIKAWKKVISEDPKNGDAWYSYFYATRLLVNHDTDDKRTWEEKNRQITGVVEEMGKAIPGSYEYNLCKWISGGLDLTLLPYLEKADKMGEGHTHHYDHMINMGEIERDINKRNTYCLKKYNAGEFSAGIMYYNYNVLKGLAPHAILLTAGDNDTYPVWALQARGIRTDVTVINLSLINLDEYRKKLLKEIGVAPWTLYHDENGEKPETVQQKFTTDILTHLAANSNNFPVYIALTCMDCDNYTPQVQENLFLTGLAYLYSAKSVDNIALLKKNFEREYALDYISMATYNEISPELVKQIDRNYEVPLMKLYEHYKLAGDAARQDWAKQKLLQVSTDTPDAGEVRKQLGLE